MANTYIYIHTYIHTYIYIKFINGHMYTDTQVYTYRNKCIIYDALHSYIEQRIYILTYIHVYK